MRSLMAGAVAFLVSGSAFAADSYICVPDAATGFVQDQASQKWRPTQFDVSGKKYLLKRTGKGAVWSKFGSTDAPDKCTDFDAGGFTTCSFLETVQFNEKSLRYQLIYPVGYMSGALAGPMNDLIAALHESPYLEIGSCSAF